MFFFGVPIYIPVDPFGLHGDPRGFLGLLYWNQNTPNFNSDATCQTSVV